MDWKKRKKGNILKGYKIRKRSLAFLMVHILLWTGCWWDADASAQEEGPGSLYAQSAVLMDADSGRILFSKNGTEERANASTTKIMTCILALEYGSLDGTVTASKKASAQPKVHLGVREGQTFYLRDLLYSLMLESHNDSAVMIAESVGGSVEGFADMMNAKAEELGCMHTYFITPNGLDASDDSGKHHTTAEELARIMKYCIMDSPKKDLFLEITRTQNYQFSDCEGVNQYSCVNHNAFLQMMQGALSGKTGFTSEAGYCYVGALRDGERTFIAVLLACGWPNNKSYKWADTKKLMNYGLENYTCQTIWKEVEPGTIRVKNGMDSKHPFHIETTVKLQVAEKDTEWTMLLKSDEQVEVVCEKQKALDAPVKKGQKAGQVTYSLNGEILRSYDIVTAEMVDEKNGYWYLKTVFRMLFLQNATRG